MTTLILDWSDWDGAASGWVSLTRVTWRRDPDTYQVPWTRQVRVEGRATVDVQGMAGEVLRVRWTPDGGASRSEHVLVPAEGEHLVHLLERVDESTLDPLPEDMPSATELVARTEALVARIESGEFTGADGVGVESVSMVGAVARFTWTDGTTQDVDLSALAGDDGEDGVGIEAVTLDGTTLRFSLSDGTAQAVDAAALRGKDGHTPDLSWDGTRLVVDGVPGPDLKGAEGHTPVPAWQGTALSWDGGEAVDLQGVDGKTPTIKIGSVTSGTTPSATITGTSPDLTLGLVLPKGDPGTKGDPGAPGVVSSASSYVIVGPGRPDVPSTTAGTITGAEPVGAEYRSTDGAQVGAYVWMKRPGNRWEVISGDTGWRDITALQTNPAPTSGRLIVRRVGGSISAGFEDLKWATGSGGTRAMLTFPSGFAANAKYMGALYGASVNTWGYSFRTDWPEIWPTSAGDIWLRDYRQWSTAQPWPTAPLPGSPA